MMKSFKKDYRICHTLGLFWKKTCFSFKNNQQNTHWQTWPFPPNTSASYLHFKFQMHPNWVAVWHFQVYEVVGIHSKFTCIYSHIYDIYLNCSFKYCSILTRYVAIFGFFDVFLARQHVFEAMCRISKTLFNFGFVFKKSSNTIKFIMPNLTLE